MEPCVPDLEALRDVPVSFAEFPGCSELMVKGSSGCLLQAPPKHRQGVCRIVFEALADKSLDPVTLADKALDEMPTRVPSEENIVVITGKGIRVLFMMSMVTKLLWKKSLRPPLMLGAPEL